MNNSLIKKTSPLSHKRLHVRDHNRANNDKSCFKDSHQCCFMISAVQYDSNVSIINSTGFQTLSELRSVCTHDLQSLSNCWYSDAFAKPTSSSHLSTVAHKLQRAAQVRAHRTIQHWTGKWGRVYQRLLTKIVGQDSLIQISCSVNKS